MMVHTKSSRKASEFKFKKYIDYDKEIQVFYHNYFFVDYKIVLKIVLTTPLSINSNRFNDKKAKMTEGKDSGLKLERFNLSKYVYLLYYE